MIAALLLSVMLDITPAGAMQTIPVVLSSKWPEVEATLNQDGTWTYGNLADFHRIDDEGFDCVVDELKRTPPPNNPAPDNSGQMSSADVERVMCADPIIRACLPKLRSWVTCAPQISTAARGGGGNDGG